MTETKNNEFKVGEKIKKINLKINLVGDDIEGTINYNYETNTENSKSFASHPTYSNIFIPTIPFELLSTQLKKPYLNKNNQKLFLNLNDLIKFLEKIKIKEESSGNYEELKKKQLFDSKINIKEEQKLKEKHLNDKNDLKKFEDLLNYPVDQLTNKKKIFIKENIQRIKKNIEKDKKLLNLISNIKGLELEKDGTKKQREAVAQISTAYKNHIEIEKRLKPNIIAILSKVFFSPNSYIFLKGHRFIIDKFSPLGYPIQISFDDKKSRKHSDNPLDYEVPFFKVEQNYIEYELEKYQYQLDKTQLEVLRKRLENDLKGNSARITNYAEQIVREEINPKFRYKGIVFGFNDINGITIIKGLSKPEKAIYLKTKGVYDYRLVTLTLKVKQKEKDLYERIGAKCQRKRLKIDKKLLEIINSDFGKPPHNYPEFIKFAIKNLGHKEQTFENLKDIGSDSKTAKKNKITKKGGKSTHHYKKRSKKLNKGNN